MRPDGGRVEGWPGAPVADGEVSCDAVRVPTPTRRLLMAALGLVVLTTGGTVGYMVIEEMPLLDAAYMTVTTLSTVGYGEVHPLSPDGRIFTMVLIALGVGNAGYLLGSIASLVVEGQLRNVLRGNAMQRRIDALNDHVIVCGFGRFGRVVATELSANHTAVVVVDADPQKEIELRRTDFAYVIGDALTDDVLEQAGIRRARALVAATASDPNNVFLTLSARERNPAIRVHARGESDGGLRHLRLAGADQVISAYQSGGIRVATAILRPSVVDFLEVSLPGRGDEVALEEVRVGVGSELTARSLRAIEADSPRLRVVAWKRGGDTPLRLIPDPETTVEGGDLLVVVGERPALDLLARRALGRDTSQ